MRDLALHEPRPDYARDLRTRATDAERRLWARLRNRRLLGVKFRRQDPVGPYIVDFCSRELKLIVELDGGQHATQAEYDAKRTEYLEASGYRVVRFWNNDVLRGAEAVVARIARLVGDPSPRPSPQGGEGEGPSRRA